MLSLTSILIALIFGVAAIVFSIKEDKAKKELLERERKQKQRLYELSILKEIQERIGYELDLEKVIEVLIGSLKNLFPYSSASSLFLKDGELIFKAFLEEEVSRTFIEQVKSGMRASFSELSGTPLSKNAIENLTGLPLNNENTKTLASFFHIPLILKDKVVGLISISSTTPGLYKEDEMTILYQIANQASNALSKLQDVLETEKGKLMAMIGSLADGVFMVGTNHELLIINDAAKKLLNITREKPNILDVAGNTPNFTLLSKQIEQAITQNINIQQKEAEINNKVVQLFVTPVASENGVIGASVLLHDITLEKNLLKMKEDFTNIIIHELRAPLTAIKSASELMAKSDDKLDFSEQVKLLNIIDEQSKKLLDEVSMLLDSAKLEAGQFTVLKQPGDIKTTLLHAFSVFSAQAESKNISLQSRLSDNLPEEMNFDPLRVGQIVNNLVSNSLKFTREGGTIILSAEKKEEKLPQDGQNGNQKIEPYVLVSVADNGIGIPKDKQKEVFSKFSQINYPTDVYTKQYALSGIGKKYNLSHLTTSTGLGLYITKAIVEAHGGTIFFESEEGKGTIISFTLPIS